MKYISIVLLVLLLTSACKDDGKQTVDVVKVGYIPIADCAQLFVADREGYFREEGIEVELVKQAGGATILPALAANHIHIGFSNIASTIIANDAGLPIQPICGGPITDKSSIEGGILSLKTGNINGLADLAGKKIAVNTTQNIVHLFVSEMLMGNGVDTTNVEFVGMPFPEMYPALLAGNIDAVASIEPFVTFAKEGGEVRDLGDYFTGALERVQISTYNVSNDGALTPQQISSFRRAIARATQSIESDRNVLYAAIAAYTSLDIDQVGRVGLPSYDFEIDSPSFSAVSKLLHKRGWTKSLYDIDALIGAK